MKIYIIEIQIYEQSKLNKDIILITGSAGFVGFHATYFYLSQGYKILGIDALNQYYDVNLKLKRNEILSSFENYIFSRITRK